MSLSTLTYVEPISDTRNRFKAVPVGCHSTSTIDDPRINSQSFPSQQIYEQFGPIYEHNTSNRFNIFGCRKRYITPSTCLIYTEIRLLASD